MATIFIKLSCHRFSQSNHTGKTNLKHSQSSSPPWKHPKKSNRIIRRMTHWPDGTITSIQYCLVHLNKNWYIFILSSVSQRRKTSFSERKKKSLRISKKMAASGEVFLGVFVETRIFFFNKFHLSFPDSRHFQTQTASKQQSSLHSRIYHPDRKPLRQWKKMSFYLLW